MSFTRLQAGCQEMRACELDGVIRRLEECDRPTDICESLRGATFARRNTSKGPVQADLRIAVRRIAGASQSVTDDVGCTRVISRVGQGVAQECGVANLEAYVVGY